MRRTFPLVVLLAVSAAGCGSGAADAGSSPAPTVTVTRTVTIAASPSGPETFLVSGSLALSGTGSYLNIDDSACTGTGGYDDIDAGAQVTVYDQAGGIVARGVLDSGTLADETCTFTFTVPDVPSGPPFYQVEVAHRGKLTETAADLQDTLALTLGS